MAETKVITTHKLVIMAMLVALQVILSRFLSINLWNLKIGFSFVPIIISAIMLGPLCTCLVAAVSDVIGAILFPTGTFFPGFTFTAALSGVIFGYFLYKKQDLISILLSVLLYEIVCSLILNTYWISLMYGAPFSALLPPRIVQSIGMGIVQIIIIRILAHYTEHLRSYA